ncbi:MAG: class SAM-dependent methyltransferase [Verrucomicrobiales bacterium]|nr:class SAM-dependent methyltransferase [Verrucomicrobiales bacterium]
MNTAELWPKTIPPLTPEQQQISDDFMRHWHEVLPKKYGVVDDFNHGYPVRHAPGEFLTTLEIGAGLGEHLAYETLTPEQQANYVALELRANMAEVIQQRFPAVQTSVGDCQGRLDFPAGHFERILAIHVLEHLPNLPVAIREMHRLCHPQHGVFSVVIPCEGGLAYSMARKISAQRVFERRYHQSYNWFIEREHINRPAEILRELEPFFTIEHRSFFPLKIPAIWCNLCIGLTLRPKSVEMR